LGAFDQFVRLFGAFVPTDFHVVGGIDGTIWAALDVLGFTLLHGHYP
jgi:hypothetical protein